MDSEFTDALLRAAHEAEIGHPVSDLEWRFDGRLMHLGHEARRCIAVARVALEHAAEVAEKAGQKSEKDFSRNGSESDGAAADAACEIAAAIRALISDEVEGLLPVEGT